MRQLREVPIALLTLMLSLGNAQQLIDGSITPELIPDDDAYLMLFLVMRTQPPPHWDLATKMSYLEHEGLSRWAVEAIIRAADRFSTDSQPLDSAIKTLNQKYRGQNQNPTAVAQFEKLHGQRLMLLRESVVTLRTELRDEAGKLQQHVAHVKKGMKMYVAYKTTAQSHCARTTP